MKNKTNKMLAVGIILFIATITATHLNNSVEPVQFTLDEIESLASCEVKRNNKVIFRCDGEKEDNCQEKYKSMFTGEISIECSGTYVELKQ